MSAFNTNAAEEWAFFHPAPSAAPDTNESDSVSNDGRAHEERCSNNQLTGVRRTVADRSQIPVQFPGRRFSQFDDRAASVKGCTVLVSPLPMDMTIRDVLPRISGGTVAKVTLTQFKNFKTAVITFKKPVAAQKYIQICKQPGTLLWELPTSDSHKNNGDKQRAMAVLPKLQHPLQHDPFEYLLTPHLYSPLRHLPRAATRCIQIQNVPLSKLPEIWVILGLESHLRIPHYRNQLEDIWLERPTIQTLDNKRVVHMDMHIWFTSIGLAYASRITQRYAGQFIQPGMEFKPWNQNVRFEQDPCMLRDKASGDGSGLKLTWSSHGHLSLISLYDLGQLGELFEMLQTLPRVQESVAMIQAWKTSDKHWKQQLKKLVVEETASCIDIHCLGLEYARRVRNKGFTILKNQDYALHFHHHMLDIRRPKCFLSTLDVFSSLVPSCSTYCPAISGHGTGRGSPCADYQLEVATAFATKEEEEEEDDEIAATLEATTPKQYPDYSRENWEAGFRANGDKYAYYWTIGIEEYCSLTPEQLSDFGRPGYIPPPGFTTIKKHLAQRSNRPSVFDG